MFKAELVQNENGSSDIVMTRKDFAETTDNTSLASYLEANYASQKAQGLFTALKQAPTASAYSKALSEQLGMSLLPNFAQENFNIFRSLGNLITDNLFNKDLTKERMMVGYDYLSLERSTQNNITGYENHSNSSYFLGDITLDKYSRFGMGISITQFNSDYDDDSDRDETFAQALASYMYDFKNNWRYAGVARAGYGFGDYSRRTSNNDFDGNLHDIIYGLSNELRYSYETKYFTLEPQLELNFAGYYQRGINEENKSGALITDSTNNFSVESGIGLYASKEFNLEKYGRFKGRLGGSYYHEWAQPYHSIKAHLRNTDGSYKIESDDIFKRDRFMIGADITYSYQEFDLYLRGSTYIEHDDVTVINAGIKYNF